MTIIQAIVLGIVEGVTEFLPISSTGHLILANKLIGVENSDFTKSFELFIQLGAILAVVFLYRRRLFPPLNNSMELLSGFEVWKKVLVAFAPTAVLGFLLYKIIKNVLLGNPMIVVWALGLGGLVLIAFEIWHKKRLASGLQDSGITLKKSFAIGVVQSLAAIPGVSRSGATIVGGLLMGVSREKIVEFSFLLAVPTMLAATAYDLYKSAGQFSFDHFGILAMGFVVSFIVAMLAIKWFISYIKNHSFIWFGVYRILVAVVFYLLIFQLKI